jgi:hypothetical protein
VNVWTPGDESLGAGGEDDARAAVVDGPPRRFDPIDGKDEVLQRVQWIAR